MDRIKEIVVKEWREVFKNKFVFFTVSFLPLMITALPLGMIYFATGTENFAGVTAADLPPQFSTMCGELSGGDCMMYYIVPSFFFCL